MLASVVALWNEFYPNQNGQITLAQKHKLSTFPTPHTAFQNERAGYTCKTGE